MCGICGIYSESHATELNSIVEEMNEALWHRGPDDSGMLVENQHAIAMRRLSIIDLAGGHQPIRNETGNLAIVFNGEIYNFPELRERLVARGHEFRTQSDTEVILHLFEDEGENTPALLRGMFAFCIYDRARGSFFLARDRFGEKPLHYYCSPPGEFAFSSEIGSLLRHPGVPRRLNHEALGYFLRTGMIPAPLTMFQDVRVLPAGHWMRWQDGALELEAYYSIDYRPDGALESSAAAVDAVHDALERSVERQRISDVPLGALLSGGIDSCAVAASLQAVSSRPVKTFTIRFEDAAYDEGKVARQVAQHLGTDHHEIVIGDSAFHADDLWRIVDHVGSPFFDSSAIPTYVLSHHVAREVKVALSGDGGDEMFAGYDLFRSGAAIRRVQRLPRALLRAGAATVGWASGMRGLSKKSELRRLRRGLDGALLPRHMLPIALHTLFEPSELELLVTDADALSVATGELPLLTALPREAEEWSGLRQLMYFRLKHVLQNRMLTKVDRMSMAASLEVRTPLLDADLAALSMRLPDRHLIENGVGKSVLRKAIRPMLPAIVFEQPKTGFDIPLHRFRNDAYASLARDLLLDSPSLRSLFSDASLESVLSAGLGRSDNRADLSVFRATHQLWALMQLSAWMERFQVEL